MVLETLLQPSSLLYIPILLTIWVSGQSLHLGAVLCSGHDSNAHALLLLPQVLAPWFHRAWIYRNVPGVFRACCDSHHDRYFTYENGPLDVCPAPWNGSCVL